LKKIDVKEMQRIKQALKDAEKHDRHSCDCDGCKYWWTIPVRMHASGMLYEIFPCSEGKHTPLSFHHELLVMLSLIIHKGLKPLHYVHFSTNQFLSRLI